MDQSTASKSPDPFEVTIKKVVASGLVVELPDGSEGWLPADEWSYERGAWDRDRSGLNAGKTVRVITWGRALQEGQRALSRRRVERNPWDEVTRECRGQFKQFVVTRLTKKFAIGEMEPGLQARLSCSKTAENNPKWCGETANVEEYTL